MSKHTGTFLHEKAKLEAKLATGKPEPTPEKHPKTLSLRQIKTNPTVFQHRRPNAWESEPHIKELSKAPENGRSLEAITIWWDGKTWTCIDGHHRIEAYKKVDYDYQSVPVRVFSGSLDEAIVYAAKGNTKDKLPMHSNEKREAAWRLTIGTDLSKADVVEATGVSDGTVANMRKVKKTLLGKDPEFDLSSLTWMEAFSKAKGKEQDDIDWEDRLEKDAEKIAALLAKHLPKSNRKFPETFARAIEIYDTRLAENLMEHWGSKEDGDEEETSED